MVDDYDDPARAAESRRPRRDPADGLSTTERLARLRDGLQKGVNLKGGAARRATAAGSLRGVRAGDPPPLDEDVYGAPAARRPEPGEDRAERERPREPAPAGPGDPSLVRSMLREMRDPEDDRGLGDGSVDDTMIDPVTGGAILRAPARGGSAARRGAPRGREASEAEEPPVARRRDPRERQPREAEWLGDEPQVARPRRRAETGRDAPEEQNWSEPHRDEYDERAEPRRPRRRREQRDGGAGYEEARAPRASRLPERKPARRTAPFCGLERMLAGRYLRARRKEGFISVIALLSLIGIALGVATLIIVMSVMNGFRSELVSKIVGVNGHLTVTSLEGQLRDYDALAQRIHAVPGVTRAAPLIEGQAFASTARAGAGVLVRGVSHGNLMTLEKVAVSPESSLGSLTAFGDGGGVAIGSRLARKMGVTVGDRLTLISPRGAVTPFGVTPRRRSYEILYVFKVGMAQYDEGVVFMPLEEAQKFFNKPDTVDVVEVMVATPDQLDGYREDIEAAAGQPLLIGDWKQANGSLIGALRTERTVMFLILSLLIVIASLIIISGLIMLVKEKRGNIAILRTMGMSRGAVLRVFFMCGAAIGFVGTGLGVTLGVLFCLNIETIQGWVEFLANGEVFPEEIYVLSRLPAQLHWEDVGMTVAISLGLSFLATLYPAWRAARLDPVEALRYE